MKHIYFVQLGENDQKEVVLSRGAFLFERQDDTFVYALYQLFSFYVELIYNVDKGNLWGLHSFNADSERHLQPYLKKIDISDALFC